MASKTQVAVVDVEQGGRRSYSDSGSDEEEEEEEKQRRSSFVSGSSEEIVDVSEESTEEEEMDLECGGVPAEVKVHVARVKRDCRICHLSMDATNHESGIPIELGCSCKEDLAAAHKQCAEAWFKIKGNKTCEICGSTARNVAGVNEVELAEQWNEANDTAMPPAPVTTTQPAENRNFWQGHRFLNFLLACMVFAFVISWLFHFNLHKPDQDPQSAKQLAPKNVKVDLLEYGKLSKNVISQILHLLSRNWSRLL
ncbi:hypothetical protein ACLB2K_074739 [Fragaria x ananassa]